MNTADRILELALEAGFDLAALAPLGPPRDGERFGAWLEAGRHAGMGWLEAYRERIQDPRRIDPAARSLLLVGLGHHRPAVRLGSDGDDGRVARYAAGRDYHNLLTKRLRGVARRLRESGLAGTGRILVDAGPLLERSHAEEAGLGFASKAANLLHPTFGPWFFLGELFLDLELDPAPAPTPPPGSCGTCTACIDACPTTAILEPGVVDAGRCISYHTIENRGTIPRELRPSFGPWAFGCDVCSEVCPWGSRAPDAGATFGTHPFVGERSLVDWLEGTREELIGSPLLRAGPQGLARNAAVVLGNLPSDRGQHALLDALEHPSPLVRGTAFDSLARAHARERTTGPALERALDRESDEAAKAEMEAARAEHL